MSSTPGFPDSIVLEWARLPVRATPVGERRDLFDGATRTFRDLKGHITTLNPAETPHVPHRHPDEELILVREGTLEVTVNGAVHTAGAGAVIFLASQDEHGLRNAGPGRATYFVFRFVTAETPAAAT